MVWSQLCRNPNAIPILEQNIDKVNWWTLSKNPNAIDLTNTIANPYIGADGTEYKIAYPNSSENMAKRLIDGVGYYDQSSLPPWMTSNQPGSNTTTFNPPLGYTKAVVLAYTVPGASKLIAYRLRNSGINFSNIEFTVDISHITP